MSSDQRFHGYWGDVTKRLPALALGPKVKLSGDKVKELMEEAYHAGFQRAETEKSLFDQIFGKDRR